ncbi:MAG: hypothetical protein RR623_09025 [Bacilli bacterium]
MYDEKINNADIKFMKRVLENYKYRSDKLKFYKGLSDEYKCKVDDETRIKAVSYGNDSHTTSTPVTPYVNELIIMQATYEAKANEYKLKIDTIERVEQLSKRLLNISKGNRETIEFIYFRGMSITDLASQEGVSKQAIAERINNAIYAMLEVKF